MAVWNINLPEVQKILEAAAADNEDLSDTLNNEDFNTDLESALSWGNPITASVPQAVGRLFEEQQDNLRTIVYGVNAGLLGVLNASLAYRDGHYDMAAEYQSKMIETAGSKGKDPFKWWESHGYDTDA